LREKQRRGRVYHTGMGGDVGRGARIQHPVGGRRQRVRETVLKALARVEVSQSEEETAPGGTRREPEACRTEGAHRQPSRRDGMAPAGRGEESHGGRRWWGRATCEWTRSTGCRWTASGGCRVGQQRGHHIRVHRVDGGRARCDPPAAGGWRGGLGGGAGARVLPRDEATSAVGAEQRSSSW
jgi:hypothetical protein